ncbi:unnamed protein product [Eruca vesicaria subsp. sativa]|uniref:Two-component response regulator-like APRR2 n=1 Tax=Eruca vesicaria subsp. sativa TaxID=29727 RepID=A0ABC8KVE5_ERUVS|nr:unnamed protein product [Eruca vesicaria subsp. sativa]
MVFTANDLSNWENFPKGLRVLLLDGGVDGISAAETQSKLESMDYIVTIFTDESEALSAVFKSPESFHIAIIEVNTSVKDESFKFLEAAKGLLPTIMISDDHCITTTMKCIALGAVEFLQKPLSPEKLKNIWQHVVHKAFNDGGASVSELLKPVKDSVVSVINLDTNMTIDEKDPAPSTPQLRQVSRLLDQENINFSVENVNSSTEKENTEDHDTGESKSVDITDLEDNVLVREEKGDGEKEEGEGQTGEHKQEEDETGDSVNFHRKVDETSKPINKSSGTKNLSSNKASRKKVDWTEGLHKKFVQAVEQLGAQAIPSKILKLMKVNGLTRHNVASHLQKFRKRRRNILPKDDHNHRFIQRQYNGFQQQHRPVMAYPVWGPPGVHPPGAVSPMWPPAFPSAVQLPPWHYKPPYPTLNGNTWGYPVGPPVTGTFISTPITGTFSTPPATQLDEEMIDQVIIEGISKPWMPPPLRLKRPPAESLLTELSRLGILAVPSSSCLINGSHCLC